MKRVLAAIALAGLAAPLPPVPAGAQQLDMMHGGPIDITARDGMEWRQNEQEVIARGDARAIRGQVTVTADKLTAWYRKKATAVSEPAAAAPAAGATGDSTTDGSEIYRLQADGNVHIFTATDRAQGDKATYDLDQGVLVLTGHDLKLTTPNDVITARDDLEYWPQPHMAVARGNAIVVTSDAKRIAADTLVAYTTDNPPPATGPKAAPSPPAATKTAATPNDDPLGASGKLDRVEAFGNVSIRTPTDTVTGDRGIYVTSTGMARLVGIVRITRGQNQLNGAEADVNMKTGIATLTAQKSSRVHGLVVPKDDTAPPPGSAAPATAKPATPAAGQHQ